MLYYICRDDTSIQLHITLLKRINEMIVNNKPVHIHHADHTMDALSLPWCLAQITTEGFFLRTFTIPDDHADAVNALWGPSCGDGAVKGFLKLRSGRVWEDVMIDLPTRPSRLVTVIGTNNPEEMVVFTAHGGPPAEKNLAQERAEGKASEEDIERSRVFWSAHALSTEGM
jgi:hypothetical protein